ncbi:Ubiquitin-protein ligase E3B, partial [Entomortierella beljakovae]
MFPKRQGPDKKAALLAQAKADRLARSSQKKVEEQNVMQEASAIRIQKAWRKNRARKNRKDQQRSDWDLRASQLPTTPALGLVRNLQLTYLLLQFYDPDTCPMDSRRLSALCKLLLSKSVIVADSNIASIQRDISTSTIFSELSTSADKLSGPSHPGLDNETVIPNGEKKPMTQVPFQMVLLHARYANFAATTIKRLIQICIKVVTGYHIVIVDNSSASSPVSSPSSSVLKSKEQELYLSGPELRFLMTFVDTNTYRLPNNVNSTIRTQLSDRGTSIIMKVLDSGKFYKDVRVGILPRVEALIQMQERERSKKSTTESPEAPKQKLLQLWITAIWRSCLLLQSVDKDFTEKHLNKPVGKQHKENLINLYSDESTAVGIACHILTVPLFVNCLDDLCLQLALQSRVLKETLDAVLDIRHQQYILSAISLNDTLSLLGNIIQLHRVNKARNTEAVNMGLINQQVEVAILLLTHCQKYVSSTQTNEFRQYHPVFSWTNISQKNQQLSTLQSKLLIQQLEYLWSREFALATFRTLLSLPLTAANSDTLSSKANDQMSSQSSLKQSNKSSDPQSVLLSIEVQQACLFYMILMKSFDSQKTKILVNLMYLPKFLAQLWKLMTTLGPKGKMYIYLEAAASSGRKGLDQEPLIAILQIFCECCARFFITLDDDDMYEQQKTWELSELVFMSGFLNQFCFSILSQQQDVKVEPGTAVTTTDSTNSQVGQPSLPPIFYHARHVLLQLYERDCRRAFCPPNHWLLMHPTKSVFQSPLQLLASLSLSSSKSSSTNPKNGGIFSFSSSKAPPQYATPKEFIAKVWQKDKTALQILETMSHVIPFGARLEIFRDFIKEDRLQRAQSQVSVRPEFRHSTMVKVRRGYVLEDGFQNLSHLSVNGWKSPIRVKFVNESGVDEAGIDQGGPFKEFMESFLEAGFSPNLNLFTTSAASMNMLYPSPTSHYTHPSNGLELFRLFGKMLGKAMYEGLLIEVKFANFFLSKILGRTVFLDEMRSYDEQVFQNLMFVKKYDGDVEDLGLTFSLDEEIFGTHRTIELMAGGKDVDVTKDNRINYIFKVSDYRLNKQIHDQSKAFIDGFRSVIPLHWISIFSPQELHRVMAGEDVDFDVQDLRAHTQYQNGYFDQHPVIRNLWVVLEDFNSEEKRAFLKFVTSCSKPPLGGFKHLYPPFSIRMVMTPTVSDSYHDNSSGSVDNNVTTHDNRTAISSSDRGGSAGSSQHQRVATTGSIGSRFRSAFSSSGSSTSSPTSPRAPRSNQAAASSSSSSSSSPFALTIDEHGTPAPMGVVKSIFGGVLGSSKSSSENGKKARLPT